MTGSSPLALAAEALKGRGLLRADAAALPETAPGRPWFVSLLLGFSGWLAGLFCLAFFGVLLRPQSSGAYAAIGLLLLAFAYGLYRMPGSAFVEQVALAFSMAGHVALTIALAEGTDSAGGTAFGVALLQAGWLLVAPNRTARLLATFFGCIAWALSVRFAWWGHDFDHSRQAVSLGAALLGWFIVWGPAALGAWALVSSEPRWMAAGRARLLRPILSGLLLALTYGTLGSQPLQSLLFWEPEGPARTNWLALWPLLSVGAALLALAIAHALRSRALKGAAIAAALLHVFHFYMLVGTTLLTKSAIMAVVGLLLLASAALLERHGRAT